MSGIIHKAFIFIFILIVSSVANADMGAFVPYVNVDLREPGQKAIIAYDGFEEILILGTDMESSRKGKVLRFIPLPNEPEVQLAEKSLERMASLIKSKKLRYYIKTRGIGGKDFGAKPMPPEIVFHQRLGAHDVTVVKVENAEHFTAWLDGFLAGKDLPTRPLREQESVVIEDYLRRGFVFFVFDIVELEDRTKTVDPILYRFATTHFYYPLITSNLFGHRGQIELFVILESNFDHIMLRDSRLLRISQPSPVPNWSAISNTVSVENREIAPISKGIAELMGRRAYLTAYVYQGMLKFKHDIWLKAPDPSTFRQGIRVIGLPEQDP
jgi:hypothetical protein